MPKKAASSSRKTYWNETQKHQIVEDFTISYTNKKVWVRNEPIFVIDWSPIEKPLSGNRVIVVGNVAYMMGDPYDTWSREKNILIKRGEGEANRFIEEMKGKGISYLGQPPQTVERLNEILSRASPPDDIPSKIDELVKKYSDAIKVSEEEKLQVENELYSRIITLKIDGRLIGDFEIQPLRDQQLANFAERLDNFEKRMNILDRRLDDFTQSAGVTRIQR